jgi:hypothetical protein
MSFIFGKGCAMSQLQAIKKCVFPVKVPVLLGMLNWRYDMLSLRLSLLEVKTISL